MKSRIIYLVLIFAVPSFIFPQYKGGNGGGDFASGTTNTPLPIHLASFTYIVNQRSIKLNWVTASEQNNSGFDIERKTLTGKFSKIGYMHGMGTLNTTTNYSFEDRNLQTEKYQYRLKQIDYNGNFEYHNLSGIVEIGVPAKFYLSQNYPNPFNPVTKIDFDLPYESKVKITVFDLLGREIKILLYEVRSAGYYTIQFDASAISSGLYFYRFIAEGENKFVKTNKLVVLK